MLQVPKRSRREGIKTDKQTSRSSLATGLIILTFKRQLWDVVAHAYNPSIQEGTGL